MVRENGTNGTAVLSVQRAPKKEMEITSARAVVRCNFIA